MSTGSLHDTVVPVVSPVLNETTAELGHELIEGHVVVGQRGQRMSEGRHYLVLVTVMGGEYRVGDAGLFQNLLPDIFAVSLCTTYM